MRTIPHKNMIIQWMVFQSKVFQNFHLGVTLLDFLQVQMFNRIIKRHLVAWVLIVWLVSIHLMLKIHSMTSVGRTSTPTCVEVWTLVMVHQVIWWACFSSTVTWTDIPNPIGEKKALNHFLTQSGLLTTNYLHNGSRERNKCKCYSSLISYHDICSTPILES